MLPPLPKWNHGFVSQYSYLRKCFNNHPQKLTDVRDGVWRLDKDNFLFPSEIPPWAVFNLNPRTPQNKIRFVLVRKRIIFVCSVHFRRHPTINNEIYFAYASVLKSWKIHCSELERLMGNVGSELGMRVPRPQQSYTIDQRARPNERDIENDLREFSKLGVKFVIVILPNRNETYGKQWKLCNTINSNKVGQMMAVLWLILMNHHFRKMNFALLVFIKVILLFFISYF